MTIRKTIHIAGLVAFAAITPAVLAIAAHAQTSQTAPQGTTGQPPAQAQPSAPAAPGAIKVSPPMAKDAAAAATVKDVVIGSTVIGSDGQKIGEVKGVKSAPSGTIEEIHVKTGGMLGFGGKVVIIPAAKISKGGGQTVQVTLTAADISKLPPFTDTKG